MTGQFDEAIVALRKALQLNQNFLPAHIFLAASYSSAGRDVEPSVSKPLMRCRNVLDDVKTGVPTMSQDKSRGNLSTAWVASGIKVAGP